MVLPEVVPLLPVVVPVDPEPLPVVEPVVLPAPIVEVLLLSVEPVVVEAPLPVLGAADMPDDGAAVPGTAEVPVVG